MGIATHRTERAEKRRKEKAKEKEKKWAKARHMIVPEQPSTRAPAPKAESQAVVYKGVTYANQAVVEQAKAGEAKAAAWEAPATAAAPTQPTEPADQMSIINRTGTATGRGGDVSVAGQPAGEQPVSLMQKVQNLGAKYDDFARKYLGGPEKDMVLLDAGIMGGGSIAGAAAGKLATGVQGFRAGAMANTVTGKLTKSYLQKLVSGLKNPFLHLTLLGTTLYTSLFWGPNEKGDALVTLAIAQRDAADAGDWELVHEIDGLIQEVSDIAASIPVIGFAQAELAKFEAARKASEASKSKVNTIIEDKKYWADKEAREIARDEENRAYYDNLEKRKQESAGEKREYYEGLQRKEEKRAEEEKAYYEKLQRQEDARKEEERAYYQQTQMEADKRAAEEKAYWDAQRILDAAETAEERAYWEKVTAERKKAWEDGKKSTLKFGLL